MRKNSKHGIETIMAIGDFLKNAGLGAGEAVLAMGMGYGIATLGMQTRLPPATIYALSAGAGLGVTVIGKKITTLEGLNKHKVTVGSLMAFSVMGSAFAFA
jgi:hypothetical protein